MGVLAQPLERFLRDETERRLDSVSRNLELEMKILAPRDLGDLAASIEVTEFLASGNTYRAKAAAKAEHASFTDTGTGIYGPTGQRIRPSRARALVFYWKRGPEGPGVYAYRSVAGTPAQKWWSEPLPEKYQAELEAAF